jgi:hypothetical protein
MRNFPVDLRKTTKVMLFKMKRPMPLRHPPRSPTSNPSNPGQVNSTIPIVPPPLAKVTSDFFKIAFRPVPLFFYPAICWGTLCYGTSITWVGVFGVTLAQVFGGPQYNFTAGQVGLIGLSSWIFSVIANLGGGPLCDWIVKILTRRNRGTYEPEFRLVLIIPGLIIGSIGYFGFGWSIENGAHWIVPVVFYGLAGMGAVFLAIPVYTYVVDSHRALAPEAFVTVLPGVFHLTKINFFKDTLTFGFTFFVNNWIVNSGVKEVFIIIGGINIAVCLPAFVLCTPQLFDGANPRYLGETMSLLGAPQHGAPEILDEAFVEEMVWSLVPAD